MPHKDRETFLAYHREYYANHQDELQEYGREYARNHKKERAEYIASLPAEKKRERADKRRMWAYGITPEEYERRIVGQGDKCAICGTSERYKGAWCVDHNHETGVVRGLLCFRCNLTLGMMNDNPAAFRAAADYLEASWQKSQQKLLT